MFTNGPKYALGKQTVRLRLVHNFYTAKNTQPSMGATTTIRALLCIFGIGVSFYALKYVAG